MRKGLIFDIKKYSVNDGQGIRTTVFFKGCPLSCGWCHNPESRSCNPQLVYYIDKCIACGLCVSVCPEEAIVKNEFNVSVKYESCVICGNCANICPVEAFEIAGKEYTSDELIEIITKDFLFYDESKGGVTFSGGEPFVQKDFLLEVLKKCKKHGLNTVIDTTGYTLKENLLEVLPFTDTFLYDIKHMNPEIHKKLCGVPNDLILDNLRFLVENNADIRIRIPVIPNLNDGQNIYDTIDFLKKIKKLRYVDLLPYHNIMVGKYERFGMEFEYDNIKPPKNEYIESIKEVFESNNFEVTIGG
jgi:pyruvate formate lyase activating enzyme